MAGKVLEVLLDRIEVKETGVPRGSGRHMLLGSLIWPRPRIAERAAAKALRFDGKVADLKNASWADRIVWKEVIDGAFAVRFAVTERVTDSQLAGFVRSLGSSILKLAGGEAEDMIASSIGGGLVKLPFQLLSTLVAASGKKGPKVIASGSLDLDSKKTWPRNTTRQFKMPLTAPQALHRVTRTKRDGVLRTRRKKIMDAGAGNGLIAFSTRVS